MKTLLGLISLIVVVIMVAVVARSINHDRRRQCEAKGGEYHNIDRGSICVKPGSVIR